MPMGSIVVLGGGGFVGRHIVSKLVSDVYRVIVPTRRREAVKHLIVLPTVDVVEEDIHDPKVLANAMIYNQSFGGGSTSLTSLLGVVAPRSGPVASTSSVTP